VRFKFDVEFIVVLSGKMKEERIRSAPSTRMRAVRGVMSVSSVQHGYSRLLHKQANCGTIFDDFLTYLC
jgi:hypothetical protein